MNISEGLTMSKSVLFWVLAFLITVASGVYQRVTGPSYPISGSTVFEDHRLVYQFDRSHPEESDHAVVIGSIPGGATGTLQWRRHGIREQWREVSMERSGDTLRAMLPLQPPAGKLDYRVQLIGRSDSLMLPGADPVVIRFTAEVPTFVLVLHVIAMFTGMLLSTRAGLEALSPSPRFGGLVRWTLGILLLGGFLLGPVIQKYAFGEFWTGWPFGHDLTDNKTLVAILAWVGAAIAVERHRQARTWVIVASVVTFVIFLIPHSLLGSEFDYGSVEAHSPGDSTQQFMP